MTSGSANLSPIDTDARAPGLVAVADREDPAATPGDLYQAFRAHHAGVHATARRILGVAADAEDVTQAVFERLARRLHTVRDPTRLVAFLKACTVRECLGLLRRRRWWTHRGRPRLSGLDEVAPGADTELVVAVRQLLGLLSPEERTVVVLELVERHSHEEVAAMMATSVSTVRRRLASARRRLLAHATGAVERELAAAVEAKP